jgi:hypothetical protein
MNAADDWSREVRISCNAADADADVDADADGTDGAGSAG